MSTEAFRSALHQRIADWGAANYPTTPIFYENGPTPDEDKVGPLWLDVTVRFYGGTVASVGAKPMLRQSGALSVVCFYREASGTARTDQVIDSLCLEMQARRIGGGTLWAPQRTVPTFLLGWYKTGILLPFTLG